MKFTVPRYEVRHHGTETWEDISELNSGHTPEEWGVQKKKSTPRTFVSYDVFWND